jgi:hypothetical protein
VVGKEELEPDEEELEPDSVIEEELGPDAVLEEGLGPEELLDAVNPPTPTTWPKKPGGIL